ncbi:MAG: hypothetical protein GY909_01405 [Oligoflexia bacterium]|nr:hypothetical protein [Oligoflexia bacterium]
MKKIWPLISFVLISSCATVNQKDSTLLIDSQERGVEVTLNIEEEKKKVITPSIVGIESERKFSVMWEDGVNQKYKCEWEWGRSILPNSIPIFFGPVGLGFSLVFHGVDFYTGNAYNCDQHVFRKNFETKKKKKIKAFLITPKHNDSNISKKIMEKFSTSVDKKRMIVEDVEESFEKLAHLGINNFNSPSLQDLPLKRLHKHAREDDYQYAVYFELERLQGKENQKKLIVKPVLIDLLDEGKKPLRKMALSNVSHSNQVWEKLVDAINFIPNSLTLSYFTKPRVQLTKEDGEPRRRTSHHPDSLPKLISSFGMTSVIHPQFHDTWDYSFQTFPSVGATSWRRSEGNTWGNISSYYLFYNVELSGHFALGALNIGAGYGVGTFSIQDSFGYDERKYRTMVRLGASYVAFVNQNLFVRMGADQYSIMGGIGKNSVSYARLFYETYFGIGYYYPNLRYLVRSLL